MFGHVLFKLAYALAAFLEFVPAPRGALGPYGWVADLEAVARPPSATPLAHLAVDPAAPDAALKGVLTRLEDDEFDVREAASEALTALPGRSQALLMTLLPGLPPESRRRVNVLAADRRDAVLAFPAVYSVFRFPLRAGGVTVPDVSAYRKAACHSLADLAWQKWRLTNRCWDEIRERAVYVGDSEAAVLAGRCLACDLLNAGLSAAEVRAAAAVLDCRRRLALFEKGFALGPPEAVLPAVLPLPF